MIPKAREVRLKPKIRKVLEARCRAPTTAQRDVKRARIVLLAAEGRSTRSIAEDVGVQPRIVSNWRRRFADPPAKAIVLCVDEKPSIQALERAQGYLKLPNGRALTGQSHDYKRHGTTTLFAALEVATGRIIATHSKRRRRVEFLGFMNSVVAAFPDRELHVILDNLNTHKKNERWLKKHPKVRFHFTPTRSSWLNQVEVWFSILQGQSLSGTSFTSLKQLQEHIDAYVNAYNDKAEPFVWTKKKVRQRPFKGRRITQL